MNDERYKNFVFFFAKLMQNKLNLKLFNFKVFREPDMVLEILGGYG
jgi:hypothetical protein